MKIKIEALKDVVKDPDGQIMREVMNSLEGNEGDKCTCKKCSAEYIRGAWNFYNLCDTCFAIFDYEKMKARFDTLFGEKEGEDGTS